MSSFRSCAFASAAGPVSARSGRKEFIKTKGNVDNFRRTLSFPRTRWRPERAVCILSSARRVIIVAGRDVRISLWEAPEGGEAVLRVSCHASGT